MSLNLEPRTLPALSAKQLQRCRERAADLIHAEVLAGANNVTVAQVADPSDKGTPLSVFSDKTGDRIIIVPKPKRRASRKSGKR